MPKGHRPPRESIQHVSEDLIRFFLPCVLVNPLNAREHWGTRAKRTKAHREAVALAIWTCFHDPHGRGSKWTVVNPRAPKAITFAANVARKFDDDGLVAACKALRDGLQDGGLIVSDAPDHGHVWTYTQEIQRPLGVLFTIEPRRG